MSLTLEQIETIHKKVIDLIYDDVSNPENSDYLRSIIKYYVDSHKTPLEQAQLISDNDEKYVCAYLGFDPVTGKVNF